MSASKLIRRGFGEGKKNRNNGTEPVFRGLGQKDLTQKRSFGRAKG